jgi:hypothetical protein
LDAAIGAKNLEASHTVEQRLQAYFKALPAKLSNAESTARKRIEGQATTLAKNYDAIHHATDHAEWDKARSQMKKAEGGLKLLGSRIEALF